MFMHSEPDIFGQSHDEMIHFSNDVTQYHILDPTHTQNTNLFFSESVMNLKDNWWDFLEVSNYEVHTF